MLFVEYTASSAYALVLLACHLVYAGASAHTGVPRTRASVAAESSQFLMMGLLFFEAVLFGRLRSRCSLSRSRRSSPTRRGSSG